MLAAPRRLAWQPSMRCHQLAMVVACMLPRVSRGVRLAGMSVTPAWSARMGGMRHLSMKAAAVEEMAVDDAPTKITAPLKSEFLQEMQWRGLEPDVITFSAVISAGE